MKISQISKATTSLMILLWVFAAAAKLLDYETSRSQMLRQVFPVWISHILVWAVPVVELATAGLLLISQTRRAGLYASLFLLSAFTFYIASILTGLFGAIPCSCGGVLEELTWSQHLLLNLLFLALTLVAIVYSPEDQDAWRPDPIRKGGGMRKVK